MITPELLDRLKAITRPDRTLDLAISAAIDYRGVFGAHEWRWSAMGDELRSKTGGCLDPAQFVPRWTESLDYAVRLVPEGWFWRVGHTSTFQAWAGVNQTHPDHGEEGRNEFFFKRELWEPPSTPAIALAHCALSARLAIASKKARAA